MIRINELKLPLNHSEQDLPAAICQRLQIEPAQLQHFHVFKRGYDARKKSDIQLIYTLDVETGLDIQLLKQFAKDHQIKASPDTSYKVVATAPADLTERPVVVGLGPCGLFAALLLAEMGFKPIVLERGKAVRERTKDTFGFWRKQPLNTESNVQFGEGGAGTFSDGKLYSQVKDPKHYGRKVLTEFVKAGAPEEIMYVSKPHIGTFKLVTMVEKMRARIIELGGDIRFSTRVDDVIITDGQVTGLQLSDGSELHSRYVVLAVGHSARDTFEMLHQRGVYIEAKPFSIGFRVEHRQSMID